MTPFLCLEQSRTVRLEKIRISTWFFIPGMRKPLANQNSL